MQQKEVWMRRFSVLTVFVAGFLVLSMTAAHADWVNGNGQTPKSASLGFNAKDDLTGELNYNADPNGEDAGFSAHCKDYVSFVSGEQDGNSWARVLASCTDQDDATIYLRAAFLDKGEPGRDDMVCIVWSYTNPPRPSNAFIHDLGVITAGNIQFHDDPLNPGTLVTEMMVEVP
jgi:hypothetical protein